MYKLPPLVVRPNVQKLWGVDVFQLLPLPAYIAISRQGPAAGGTRIQYPFSHGGPAEE